jgi:four helix bundle protein
MRDFKAFQLAVEFYQLAKQAPVPVFLRSQLLRAASSIALNLQEGNGRSSRADRRRFFDISFASLRECQAVIALEPQACHSLVQPADQLAAQIYCLRRSLS